MNTNKLIEILLCGAIVLGIAILVVDDVEIHKANKELARLEAEHDEIVRQMAELEDELEQTKLAQEDINEPMPEEQKWATDITDGQYELICQVVAAEARGESELCCMLVAESIRDRMITRNQSVEQVIFAKAQYAAPYKGSLGEKTEAKIKSAVAAVFQAGWKYDKDNYILHFHDTSITPYWAKDFTRMIQDGNMIFYT